MIKNKDFFDELMILKGSVHMGSWLVINSDGSGTGNVISAEDFV